MHHSGNSKRRIQCSKQSRVAEWLEQALYRSLCEQAWANRLVLVSGDEDDRNILPAKRKLILELGSGHAGHGDVENQTLGQAKEIGSEELFGRGEDLDRKSHLPQQVGQRLAH